MQSRIAFSLTSIPAVAGVVGELRSSGWQSQQPNDPFHTPASGSEKSR